MNDTSNTTNAASQSDIPQSVSDFMRHITDLCGGEHARWAENFNAGFANTLTTTVRRHDDGTTFLLTGDIPAMWLRDSSAQFRPYLAVAVDDPELTALITGLVRQQFRFINIDPYANAFNETPSGATWHVEKPEELAVLNYTSGTTSFSKGVMIPYRSLWSNTQFAYDNLPFIHPFVFRAGRMVFLEEQPQKRRRRGLAVRG